MSTKPKFVYVVYIQSTAEKVYDALSDPELTKLYWGRAKNVSDWKVGSTWQHQDYDEPCKAKVQGEVLLADRPNRLVLTWRRPAHAKGENESRLTFQVEPAFGAVRLTVTHEDLNEETLKGVSTGWPAILSSLKTLLESGQPMPMTTRKWE
jgi:uncharacterized protein YndB with AHSA1/START domain